MLLCALLTVALAQDPATSVDPRADARARELFENGSILYEEGLYEEAIVAWQAAYELSPRPLLLFNIANALERLGRWQDAMDYLSRYRAFAREDEREVLDRRIRNIERRIAEQQEAAAARPPAPPSQAKPDRAFPVVPVALFSAGGVGLVTGTVFGVGALSAREEARDACVESGGATWCTDAAGDALGRERTGALVADIAIGVGAACVVGGVVTAVLPLSVGVGPGTLVVQGSF